MAKSHQALRIDAAMMLGNVRNAEKALLFSTGVNSDVGVC